MSMLAMSALLTSAACSNTPVSPSAVATASSEPVLRWDVTAGGCAPVQAPSPLPDATTARMRIEGDGALVATWAIASSANRPLTLLARFLPYERDWALCSWDTVDQ